MEDVAKRVISGLRIKKFLLRSRPLSMTCVLTQETIKGPIFRYFPNQNHQKRPIGYSLDAILQYIHVTGKDIDPMTREKWTKRDLERIDVLMSRHKLHDAYLSPLKVYQKKINELKNTCLLIFRAALRPSDINDCKDMDYFQDTLSEYLDVLNDLRQLDTDEAIKTLCDTRRYFESLHTPFQRYHDYVDASMAGLIGAFMDHLTMDARNA